MQNTKRDEIRKQLKDLLEHLKEKNTDGTLTEACGRLSGTITAFDDDSNPPGTPPPPPGTPPPVGP